MKPHFVSTCLIVGALCLSSGVASAQTANSSPTAPADGGAGGAASAAGPSTGNLAPQPGTSKIGPPTPTEQAEQAKSNKDMTICKGC